MIENFIFTPIMESKVFENQSPKTKIILEGRFLIFNTFLYQILADNYVDF